MKKLNEIEGEIIKVIIREGGSIFELEGNKYHLSLIDESKTTVKEDIEIDPELKQKLLQAKKDILEDIVYSSEDVIGMIEQGDL